ncbi:MAG: alkaline phosphatase [Nitrospirota bacterium]|nr:alkaline phosphatase [Nitrospirota bacterium]MDP2384198.1 alkaline phosphatase [Nitrospirota bacterium]MDP3596758.1 alkaline phosphatase [Nitrospirota bacterium]
MKTLSFVIVLLLTSASAWAAMVQPVPATSSTSSEQIVPDHVILFVLEGVDQPALTAGPMPVLKRLVQDGAVTWSAATSTPPLRLPAMASLLTGLPVEKHGITWNTFEFSRGYPRPPTIFDYLDLSGGRDSAIFLMDESLYQLAKPEPYTDYQLCGPLKPECSPERLVSYIKQYFKKATSGHGYGHAILALPHLLVVHLPDGGRAGVERGWTSKNYRTALQSVDRAMGSVLEIFKEHGLLTRTTVFVTSLSGTGATKPTAAEAQTTPVSSLVPWIASGVGIKTGHAIRQPVSIVDTGATVLRAFRVETHTEWDSRVVEEIFRDAGAISAIPTKGR